MSSVYLGNWDILGNDVTRHELFYDYISYSWKRLFKTRKMKKRKEKKSI